MKCSDLRLEEYLDGELGAGEREEVAAHLAACADCRREAEELGRLEGLLRSVPAPAMPDEERYLERVRARARSRRAWLVPAAAAILLVGFGFLFTGLEVDVRAELERYAEHPSAAIEERLRSVSRAVPELEEALGDAEPRIRFAAAQLLSRVADAPARERLFGRLEGPVDARAELKRYAAAPSDRIERRLLLAGKAGMAELEGALEGGEVRLQVAGATLLFKLADEETRERVMARFQAVPNGGWTLPEIGVEEEDVELVPVAVSAVLSATEEEQERLAVGVLRRLHLLNREAEDEIVRSVVTLLMSTNPKVQKHALDIVRELDLKFPLTAIVDLIDSPDVGEEALRVLKERTGEDHGRDREAWLRAIGKERE